MGTTMLIFCLTVRSVMCRVHSIDALAIDETASNRANNKGFVLAFFKIIILPFGNKRPVMSNSTLRNPNQNYAIAALYTALVIVFVWFGAMKFTAYEAGAIKGLVENSPLISWVYSVLSVGAVSAIIGTVELIIAGLLVARLFNPKFSALGAAGAAATFVLTSSFLLSTPGVVEGSLGFPALSVMPGQFLLKDIGLFAASLVLLADSVAASRESLGE